MTQVTANFEYHDAVSLLLYWAARAAEYSAYVDHVTRKTWNMPRYGESFEESRKVWDAEYRKAKRIVEAFGAQVQYISEQETIFYCQNHRDVKGKPGFVELYGPFDQPNVYRGAIPSATAAAARRCVAKWRSDNE